MFNARIVSVKNPRLKSFVTNSGWLIADKSLRLALGLLVGAWAARYLGPEKYGFLAYAIAFISFFQAVAAFGLNTVVVRDLAITKNPGVIVGSTIAIRLFLGILCWIAAAISITFLNPGYNDVFLLVVIVGSSLAFQPLDTIDLWYQSQEKNRSSVIAKIVAYVIVNVGRGVLVYLKAPLIYFAFAVASEFFLTALALMLVYGVRKARNEWKTSLNTVQQLASESWHYMIAAVSVIVYMRIDQIMIAEYLGSHALGVYSAAIPISQAFNFVPIILTAAIAPHLAKKKVLSYESYNMLLSATFYALGFIGLTVSVMTSLLSTFIVKTLYGPSFEEASSVLAIHCFTNLFIYLGMAQSLWIVNEKKGKLALYKTFAGAVAAILGNFILIPRYGIIGAAVSAVFAQAFSAIIVNIIAAPSIFFIQIKSILLIPALSMLINSRK